MVTFYSILLWIGVFYTIVTFVLGGFFHLFDFHLSWGHSLHIEADSPTLSISPFRPTTIIPFITVLGGMGLIGTYYQWNGFLVFFTSLAFAFIVSSIIFKGIVVPLFRAQNTSAMSQNDLLGVTAKVHSKIFSEGFGTITYLAGGSLQTSAAKHIEGGEVEQGVEVVICQITDNVCYVEEKERRREKVWTLFKSQQ